VEILFRIAEIFETSLLELLEIDKEVFQHVCLSSFLILNKMLPLQIRRPADVEEYIEENACPVRFDVKAAGRFRKFFAKR
jgi:hypothetical protein